MSTPRRERSGVYWSLAWFTILLGVVLTMAPENWFGPSWHFFKQFPSNGFWMGLCCTTLGTWQMITLWRARQSTTVPGRHLGILFFLSGFVFWTSGMTLGAAGLLGHQGLMEAPFMLYVGAHHLIYSAVLLSKDSHDS